MKVTTKENTKTKKIKAYTSYINRAMIKTTKEKGRYRYEICKTGIISILSYLCL